MGITAVDFFSHDAPKYPTLASALPILTLTQWLQKQSSGVTTDEEVLRIREAKLRVVAERVGLRRLDVLAPHLRSLTLDGSALSSLRDLGIGLVHLKVNWDLIVLDIDDKLN